MEGPAHTLAKMTWIDNLQFLESMQPSPPHLPLVIGYSADANKANGLKLVGVKSFPLLKLLLQSLERLWSSLQWFSHSISKAMSAIYFAGALSTEEQINKQKRTKTTITTTRKITLITELLILWFSLKVSILLYFLKMLPGCPSLCVVSKGLIF